MEDPRHDLSGLDLDLHRHIPLSAEPVGQIGKHGKGEHAALIVLRGARFESNRSSYKINLLPTQGKNLTPAPPASQIGEGRHSSNLNGEMGTHGLKVFTLKEPSSDITNLNGREVRDHRFPGTFRQPEGSAEDAKFTDVRPCFW
jgi:hypothetical protein